MRALLHVQNKQHDPYLNMAIEEHLFTKLSTADDFFMLWQNSPAIIIGRNQNAWSEINEDYVRQHQIAVVRRMTGGGAVYHDLGNLNFTFAIKDQNAGFDFERFGRPVVRALAEFGVKAEISGRNDILIAGRKFSGNAEYRRSGRLLHHGTLLFSSDLSVLSQALQAKPQKIASKGITSVRSRVTNIAEHLPANVTLGQFTEAVQHAAAREFGGAMHPYTLTSQDWESIVQLRDQKYASWAWNFGQAPEFNLRREQRFLTGEVDVRLNIKHGRIAACYIYGDFFSNSDVDDLARRLMDRQYSSAEVSAALQDVHVASYLPGLDNSSFVQLLLGQ